MRLDQFVSQALPFSRSEAKQLVRQKRLAINGETCREAGRHVDHHDCVTLDGNTVDWPQELYFMLNKPQGYCCSHEDDGGLSALQLLPPTGKKLHFAGRLDADTTGLVLVSSDGQWCHRVTSPKQRQEKRKTKHYRVTLASPLADGAADLLENGLLLHGETHKTLPATVTRLDSHCVEIAISEGRYHQVRRMFAAVGSHVEALHRFCIGPIQLDDSLAPGQWRPLTPDEVAGFRDDA